jgi:F0F1-type ATP synthase assembly protein I
VDLVVVEVVVVVVPAVIDAFLDVLATFLVVLDGSMLAFLSSCWPFIVVVIFEQQPHH